MNRSDMEIQAYIALVEKRDAEISRLENKVERDYLLRHHLFFKLAAMAGEPKVIEMIDALIENGKLNDMEISEFKDLRLSIVRDGLLEGF